LLQKNHFHHHHQSIIGDMYNRPNEQTSMASVQGPNRHLGTQDRPRQTDRWLHKNNSAVQS
jgi:hypothetical protein